MSMNPMTSSASHALRRTVYELAINAHGSRFSGSVKNSAIKRAEKKARLPYELFRADQDFEGDKK